MRFLRTVAPFWCTIARVTAFTILGDVPQLPTGWRRLDETPAPSDPIELSLAIRQPLAGGLSQIILESDTRLTQDEAQRLQELDPDAVLAVKKWLESANVDVSDAQVIGGFVHVRTNVQTAEMLLDAQIGLYAYEHQPPVLRTQRYGVPNSLAEDVEFVLPINNFVVPQQQITYSTFESSAAESSSPYRDTCLKAVTPACLRKLYGVDTKVPPADDTPEVRFGIAGFLTQNANYQDINAFTALGSPEVAGAAYNFTTEPIGDAVNSQNISLAGIEANPDLQIAMALAYPSNITFVLGRGNGPFVNYSGEVTPNDSDTESWVEFMSYMLAKPDDDLPHVINFSYGEDELRIPRPYAERVCFMMGLLTARGTTIIVSSGDGGATGGHDSACIRHDGSGQKLAMPTFPSGCPWVTSVGAVTTDTAPLTAAQFSSGGFSEYFARPCWQDQAVEGYIKELDGHLDGLYNPRGRAIPDISAVGSNIMTLVGRKLELVEGTSFSAPVIASLLVLVNQERFRRGKRSLGFLNKRLYSDKVVTALNDVRQGITKSCTWDGQQPGGWPASVGWDAATGLGVPKSLRALIDVLAEDD